MTDNNNNSSNSNSNNNAVIMTMPLPLESTRPATTLPRPSWFVIQLTITASLGGCLFGYDLGAISGTLSQLTTTFDLHNSQKELIVSILYVGGTIGAACGGSLCDRIGRKTSIILTDIIFIVGSLWLYFSSSYEQVIIGRFLIGIGIAISGIADVSYLHECSPIQYRGSIVSVNEACISLGFLLAYISGFIFSSHEKEEWRIVFGIAGFLAAIQFIGMLLLPESPEWLIEKGRLEDAKKASERINGTAYCKSSTDGIFLGSRVEGDTTDAGVFSSDGPTALIRRRSRSRQQKNNSIDGVLEKNPMINTPILRADDYGTDSIIMTDSKGKIKEVNSSSLFGSRESLFKTTTTATTTIDSNDNPTIAAYHNNQSTRSFGFSIRHRIESIVMILSQYRRQVYIALYLAIVQQLCGQTNILNYAPLIFEEATNQDNNEQQEQQQQNYNENNNDYYEYPEDDASLLDDDWSMVIIGVVKFIVTVLVIWKIEYIGRRKLLIFGNLLIAIGLLALIIAFGGSSSSSSSSSSTITASTNDDNGDDDVVVVDNDDDDSSASTTFWSPLTNVKTFHLALPGVLLVVCGYSCSFGPLTWLLTSELFPTDIRGRALGASTIVSYMFGAISTQTFLVATSRYGPSFVFGMYCIITVCGIFFVYMAIPDTGEKTVQEIDDSLNDMPWWKYDPKILLPQYDSSTTTTPPPSLEMTSEQFATTNNNASTRTSSSSSLDQQHVLS